MTDPAVLFEIAQLNAANAAAIDADRLEEWPGFFLEQCLYKVTTADNVAKGYQAGIIYADTRAMLTDRIFALREANIYERQRYRHILGMPLISAEAGRRRSRSETSFLVIRTMREGQMDVFVAGRLSATKCAGTRTGRGAMPSGSWCATASGSIRCWRSRCKHRGARSCR